MSQNQSTRVDKKKTRRNGFQKPLNDLQIATWFLYPFILAGFYVLILPVLDFPYQIICGLIYFILHTISGISAYLVSALDPSDPHLAATDKYMSEVKGFDEAEIAKVKASESYKKGMEARKNSMTRSSGNGPAGGEVVHCYYCKTHVSRKSKHCKFCDKCVHVFDHHCKWLNNCVGSVNYKYFVSVVTFTLCFTSFHLALCAYSIWQYFDAEGESEKFRERVSSRLMMHELYIGLVIFYAAILVPIVVLIAQLFQFHLTLIYLNVTTYEYVSNASNATMATSRSQKMRKPTPQKSTTNKGRKQQTSKSNMTELTNRSSKIKTGKTEEISSAAMVSNANADPMSPKPTAYTELSQDVGSDV